MPPKRPNLGFESDSDSGSGDTEVNVKPVPYRKRSKIPKFTFFTKDIVNLETKDSFSNYEQEKEEEEEEDYLKMQILDGKSPTSFSRSEINPPKDKGRVSLFGEIREDDESKERNIPSIKSKGLSIMEKMGFKVGDTLGVDSRNEKALLEPITISPHVKNLGLGTKPAKATINTEYDEIGTNAGVTETHEWEYRSRLNREREDCKNIKIIHTMQKYCYDLTNEVDFPGGKMPDIRNVNPSDVNVLWRGYVIYIQKLLNEMEGLHEDKTAKEEPWTHDLRSTSENDEGKGDDDDELSLFEELNTSEKLGRLHSHLRMTFNYCFFCGARFDDQEDLFENCPGLTEEDHK